MNNGWTPPQHPRVIAIGIVHHRGRLLVNHGVDSATGETFYRPLGGGVEFCEHSRVAVVREFQEEMNAELVDITHLGTLETLFEYNGCAGHEIVQVYQGRLVDASLYLQDRIPCVEGNGVPFDARWIDIDTFAHGRARLVPEGLLELLNKTTNIQTANP